MVHTTGALIYISQHTLDRLAYNYNVFCQTIFRGSSQKKPIFDVPQYTFTETNDVLDLVTYLPNYNKALCTAHE